MSRYLTQLGLTACLALGGTSTWAARPFMTDDARLTTEGSCQVESWARLYTSRSEY